MMIHELRERRLIIFEVNAGSRAYNLNTPASDTDTRGIFMLPRADYLRVSAIPQQACDQKQDTIYYELRRYMELAADCNPNIIELLWTDESDIRLCAPPMRELLGRRHLSISKK